MCTATTTARAPEDIEQLVTRPLESAIMSGARVDSVTSSSADSISTIQIMYVENTDVDIAATKLREKFDALSLARRAAALPSF